MTKETLVQKYAELCLLEDKAKSIMWRAKTDRRRVELYENYHSRFNGYRRKWGVVMTELRGWEYRSSTETRQEWKDFCTEKGICYDYNFGDAMA